LEKAKRCDCVSERLISERAEKLKEYGVVVSSVVSYVLEDGPSNCDSPQDESKVKINTTDAPERVFLFSVFFESLHYPFDRYHNIKVPKTGPTDHW
jgi:hypothetical protein